MQSGPTLDEFVVVVHNSSQFHRCLRHLKLTSICRYITSSEQIVQNFLLLCRELGMECHWLLLSLHLRSLRLWPGKFISIHTEAILFLVQLAEQFLESLTRTICKTIVLRYWFLCFNLLFYSWCRYYLWLLSLTLINLMNFLKWKSANFKCL